MFNIRYHLKGELFSLCNVSANWAKSVSDLFFCLNQYLFAYFSSLKNAQVH